MRVANKIFLITLILLPMLMNAQEINKIVPDEDTVSSILIGKCDRSGFDLVEFGKIFQDEYSKYKTNDSVLNILRLKMTDVKITMVIGSWCGDSKEQVPRFFKIIDKLGVKNDRIEIYCLDRQKKAGNLDLQELNAPLVPTFIMYRDNKELGRIVELPSESLEKDLLKIVNK